MRPLIGRRQVLTAALLPVLMLGACQGASSTDLPGGGPSASPAGSTVLAQVATYQIVAGKPGRLLIALVSADNRWVSFGSVQLTFTYAGDGTDSPPAAEPMADVTATFLPIPESPPDTGGPPTLTFPSDGHGVYRADAVSFPTPGFWQVVAHATMADGTQFSADAALQAREEPLVLSVGDRAPATDNAVIGDDVPNAAVDSRASGGNPIPDPELHRVSIADAIAAGVPALVVFSTPVYCVSRFCGPVTDVVQELAAEYADRADFIHVEIWRDFEAQELNPAAVEWLATESGDFREPWTFLIGADGSIIGSWDTVVTRGEIEPMLEALPPRSGG